MNQKKAKFNIVDIIVILILVAGIAFVGVKMFGGQESADPANPSISTGTTDVPYLVTFHAESVPQEVADTLVAGSKAENSSRNMDLGTLVDFTIGESVIYSFDSEGVCVKSTKPGYVSVSLVCRVTGTQQPTGLQVGQFMLNVGHNMGVRCGNTEIVCNVWNIAPATE